MFGFSGGYNIKTNNMENLNKITDKALEEDILEAIRKGVDHGWTINHEDPTSDEEEYTDFHEEDALKAVMKVIKNYYQ